MIFKIRCRSRPPAFLTAKINCLADRALLSKYDRHGADKKRAYRWVQPIKKTHAFGCPNHAPVINLHILVYNYFYYMVIYIVIYGTF